MADSPSPTDIATATARTGPTRAARLLLVAVAGAVVTIAVVRQRALDRAEAEFLGRHGTETPDQPV